MQVQTVMNGDKQQENVPYQRNAAEDSVWMIQMSQSYGRTS